MKLYSPVWNLCMVSSSEMTDYIDLIRPFSSKCSFWRLSHSRPEAPEKSTGAFASLAPWPFDPLPLGRTWKNEDPFSRPGVFFAQGRMPGLPSPAETASQFLAALSTDKWAPEEWKPASNPRSLSHTSSKLLVLSGPSYSCENLEV